jgi:hypothetical protein
MIDKIIYVSAFICVLINIFLVYLKFDQININDEKFINLNECPYCFGTSLCQDFLFNIKHDFEIVGSDGFFFINTYFFHSLFNIKNVYFVRDKFSNHMFVFKKLGHNIELDKFDSDRSFKSFINSQFNSSQSMILKKKLSLKMLKKYSNVLNIEITKCFTNRLVDMLYDNYIEASKNSFDYLTANVNLLTSLKINPEPIVLQVC